MSRTELAQRPGLSRWNVYPIPAELTRTEYFPHQQWGQDNRTIDAIARLIDPSEIRRVRNPLKCPRIPVRVRPQILARPLSKINSLFSFNWVAVNPDHMQKLLAICIGRQQATKNRAREATNGRRAHQT